MSTKCYQIMNASTAAIGYHFLQERPEMHLYFVEMLIDPG